MDEVKKGDLKKCGKLEEKHIPLSLHEEHGRSLVQKDVIKRAT
jgi:hypothetical protein